MATEHHRCVILFYLWHNQISEKLQWIIDVDLSFFVSSIIRSLHEADLLVEEWIIGVAPDRVRGIECHPVIVIKRRTELKPPW